MLIDGLHRLPGAEHRAFLPAGHEGRVVAGELEAALWFGQDFDILAIMRVDLAGPALAHVLHVAPADRDAVLHELRVSDMQLLAGLARDAQTHGDRKPVEALGGFAAHIGAGKRAVGAEEAARRIPDLVDDIVGPGNAAVDLILRLPEARGLPADLARVHHLQIGRRLLHVLRQVGLHGLAGALHLGQVAEGHQHLVQ